MQNNRSQQQNSQIVECQRSNQQQVNIFILYIITMKILKNTSNNIPLFLMKYLKKQEQVQYFFSLLEKCYYYKDEKIKLLTKIMTRLVTHPFSNSMIWDYYDITEFKHDYIFKGLKIQNNNKNVQLINQILSTLRQKLMEQILTHINFSLNFNVVLKILCPFERYLKDLSQKLPNSLQQFKNTAKEYKKKQQQIESLINKILQFLRNYQFKNIGSIRQFEVKLKQHQNKLQLCDPIRYAMVNPLISQLAKQVQQNALNHILSQVNSITTIQSFNELESKILKLNQNRSEQIKYPLQDRPTPQQIKFYLLQDFTYAETIYYQDTQILEQDIRDISKTRQRFR